MNVFEPAVIWMSIIGFFSGLYALWVLDKDRRPDIRIRRDHPTLLRFRVVNHSQREIPIERVRLQLWTGKQYEDVLQSPILEGISIPGSLSPESSFHVRWVDNVQLLQIIVRNRFKLLVETQTGFVIRYKGRARSSSRRQG